MSCSSCGTVIREALCVSAFGAVGVVPLVGVVPKCCLSVLPTFPCLRLPEVLPVFAEVVELGCPRDDCDPVLFRFLHSLSRNP